MRISEGKKFIGISSYKIDYDRIFSVLTLLKIENLSVFIDEGNGYCFYNIGRRPMILRLNSEKMLAIGLNITRSFAELGIVDIGGNLLCEKRFGVYPKEKAIEDIKIGIGEMIAEEGIPAENIYGLGITAPGPLAPGETTILNPPNFDAWHYENIGSRLKNVTSRKVYLENVAGGQALCEKYFGVAKKMDDFLVLIVDDGIGSGIMSSGKLLRGASELGHTSIAYNGRPCECGNLGCVEKYASLPSILQGTDYRSWKEVVDRDDRALIEKEAEYLACAIINATNLFSIEQVILEGGINYKPDRLTSLIESKMQRNRIMRKMPKVLPGSGYHGPVCAAVSVFDHYFGNH